MIGTFAATYLGKTYRVVKFFQNATLVVDPATGKLKTVDNDQLTLHPVPHEKMHAEKIAAGMAASAVVEDLSAPASGGKPSKRVDLDFREGLSMGQKSS